MHQRRRRCQKSSTRIGRVATTVLAQWVRPPVTTRSFSQTAKRLAKVLDPLSVIYYACHGDVAALRRFLHSRDRENAGAFSEGWDADMVILILKYGDDSLAGVLRTEDTQTSEAVGVALETQLKPEDLLLYPQTRKLYRYRYTRRT